VRLGRRGVRPRIGAARLRRASILAGLLAISAALGCHRRLPALLAQDRVDEVIERAESSRVPPRRKAARAYAEALVRRGDVDKARSVLLVDFRKGGHVSSLVALADLEQRLGLDGIALLHYGRAASLDRAAVRGRADVCALLRRRARDLLRLDEGLMAEEDLSLALALCPERPRTTMLEDEALAGAIDAVADAQVKLRVRETRCPRAGCESAPDLDRAATIAAALVKARTEGPSAVRRVAARWRTQLEPEDVVILLLAEARGELGLDLLPDHEVRRWVGDQRWLDFASSVTSRRPAESAWLHLRLSAVLDDVPMPSARAGPTMRDRWADRSLELVGAQPWRISAYVGDRGGAEIAVAAEFRPSSDSPNEAAPAELGNLVPAHWATRVEPSARSLDAMLVVARLREAAGQDDKGLAIARFVLDAATRADVESAPAQGMREAARHLARGQPWHALAIADSVPLAAMEPVRSAAASAITLGHIVCGGPCPDDEDRVAVERVLGEGWVARSSAELPRLMGGQARGRVDARCTTLGERLGPDAMGPVTDALRRARRSLDGPGLGDALTKAIGSDPVLACAARHVLPLMLAADARLSAAALSDQLAHAPRMRAEPMLRTHAELALVAGQHARAELLAIAAAGASRDAAATWAAIARRAHGAGAREIERMALRELLMHTPGLDHEGARRALVEAGLRDLARGEMVRETDVGREAVARHVSEYVSEVAPSQQWARREALAMAVGRASWAEGIRPLLVEALLPTPEIQARHPLALAWLTGAPPEHVGALDDAGLQLERARGRVLPLPTVVDVFADPVAFEGARLEVAAGARDWSARRRTAIGLATYGSAPARAMAMVALGHMIGDDEPRRAALHEWLLARPAALEPKGAVPNGSSTRAAVVIDDEEALLRVVYGLDPSEAWFPSHHGTDAEAWEGP
jgi:predicted transcriptional regulator